MESVEIPLFLPEVNKERVSMKVNILITSVSRKVWLVNVFKDALKECGAKGKVISVDINPLSAGLYVSDKYYFVSSSSKTDFIPSILKICKKEDIKLIIPTRDKELLLFAKNKEKFKKQGIYVMVSDPEVVEICNDKYKFYHFLMRNNISTAESYLPNKIKFSSLIYPVIIKPRYGSGSRSIFKAESQRELKFFINYVSDPIIQEFVNGEEYTVDLFSDFNRRVISIIPRQRIETFCGESYKGKTVKDFKIIECAKILAEKLGTIGHITIQCIKKGNRVKFIEVNPRFGGGAILGIKAGANTPLLLLNIILGKKIEPQIGKFKENLVMLRYTKDLFILNKR
ncbi:MAG: ATP-grasp domain-containing protein [Candidatus Omnitrophica bacterium]|nr:ATP-grasp domain-containing protein [Candidatus Omnitrophota bacterium]